MTEKTMSDLTAGGLPKLKLENQVEIKGMLKKCRFEWQNNGATWN